MSLYTCPDYAAIESQQDARRYSDMLDEFCAKAGSEGKVRYVKVVRAAAEALAEDVTERGITGGWGEAA